ncbi:MAG: hypothetical protein KCHDKBKB_00349 [Elusimicrobia bacterium]|nr:hypothetical protein [Elusimicrobiota bacterium]
MVGFDLLKGNCGGGEKGLKKLQIMAIRVERVL